MTSLALLPSPDWEKERERGNDKGLGEERKVTEQEFVWPTQSFDVQEVTLRETSTYRIILVIYGRIQVMLLYLSFFCFGEIIIKEPTASLFSLPFRVQSWWVSRQFILIKLMSTMLSRRILAPPITFCDSVFIEVTVWQMARLICKSENDNLSKQVRCEKSSQMEFPTAPFTFESLEICRLTKFMLFKHVYRQIIRL